MREAQTNQPARAPEASAKPLLRAERAARVRWLAVWASLLLASACARQHQATGIAFELRKPADWTYVTATPVAARAEHIAFDAAQLDSALATHTATPLFAVLKYPHPHAGLNPTLGVNVERAPEIRGAAPAALLTQRVEQAVASSGGGFSIMEPIVTTTLAGQPAAKVVLRAREPSPGGTTTSIMVIYVVVVDTTSFVVANARAESGEAAAAAESEQMLASIVISGS